MSLQPVFLIGAARSGTKFLRDLIHASEQVQRIPYDINYVWRTGNEFREDDEIPPKAITARSAKTIRKNIFRLQDRNSRRPQAKLLLEKTVSNALRVKTVHHLFPNARFIELTRSGYAVVESSLRQWQAPAQRGYLLQKLRYFPWTNYRYAMWFVRTRLSRSNTAPIWGPRYHGIDHDIENLPLAQVCARQWRRCVERSAEDLNTIDSARVLRIRYDELMSDGYSQCIERISDFLCVDPSALITAWEQRAQPGNDHKWRNELSKQTEDLITSEFSLMPEHLRPELP